MKNINHLRDSLFETIELLKSGKMEVDKAKAISSLGQVVVNSAKVEVEFIKEMGGKGTGFIETETNVKKLERPPAEYSNKGHESSMKKYGT
jgi:hypothetical protein